jgi:hypothetical protein
MQVMKMVRMSKQHDDAGDPMDSLQVLYRLTCSKNLKLDSGLRSSQSIF